MKTMSPEQLDLLKEMGSIGMGHAAIGLSKLLNKRVEIPPPNVQCLPFSEVASFLNGPDQVVSGIHTALKGDLSGSMLMVLPGDTPNQLLEFCLKTKRLNRQTMNAYEVSALKELANICMASYLNALHQLTSCTILCSVPALANDMLGALLNEILVIGARQSDHVLLIDTEFTIAHKPLHGYLLLIFEPRSLEKIFTTMQIE